MYARFNFISPLLIPCQSIRLTLVKSFLTLRSRLASAAALPGGLMLADPLLLKGAGEGAGDGEGEVGAGDCGGGGIIIMLAALAPPSPLMNFTGPPPPPPPTQVLGIGLGFEANAVAKATPEGREG